MTKQQIRDRDEARVNLRETLSPGDTVYTVLRHVSASGMSRDIDLYTFKPDDLPDRPPVKFWLSYQAAKAGAGDFNTRKDCIRMGGAGMDMGFALAYNLGRCLFPDGFACIGERCPSNDHSNRGSRDNKQHSDGGYALRQEWI